MLEWLKNDVYYAPESGTSEGGGLTDSSTQNSLEDAQNGSREVSIDPQIKDLQDQITRLTKTHKSELDRYRNELGQTKKKLEQMQDKELSEEEKLDRQKKQLEEKERELNTKVLNAHKAEQVAKIGLDKRLSEWIGISPDMSEDDVNSKVNELKAVQEALREEVISELQENGTVISTTGGKEKKGISIGSKLAQQANKSFKTVADSQKIYFKED